MNMEPKREKHRAIAAHHEAGHAVVAHMLGCTVRRVAIGDDSGSTEVRYGRGEQAKERAILVTLAGPYAQKRFDQRSDWRGRSHTGVSSGCDFDIVTDLIHTMHGKGKVAEAYWRYVEARAEQLVNQHWDRIEPLAEALLQRKAMTGDAMKALFWERQSRSLSLP
jgi:hypothetical protein